MPTEYDSTQFDLVGNEPTVWFTCPHCGYDKVRFPTRPEVWKKYEADGIISLRQDVVQVEHVHCLAERDVFMPISIYLPACVLSGTLALARMAPWQAFEGILVGGAIAILMYAVRYRRNVAPGPEPEPQPQASPTLPQVTEVTNEHLPNSIFRFSKDAIVYESGNPVPDNKLWRIADAFVHGTPFSKRMFFVSGRPAYEALRDTFIKSGHAHYDGQDVVLHPAAKAILRRWSNLPTPPIE